MRHSRVFWTSLIMQAALFVTACQTTRFGKKDSDPSTGQQNRPSSSDKRQDGSPCAEDDECASQICNTASSGKKSCAARCNATTPCQAGESCTKSSPRDISSPFVCIVLAEPVTCQACVNDGDCRAHGSACMQASDGKACGIDCSLEGDAVCPYGHSCVTLKDRDGNETAKQCVPQMGTCTTFLPPPPPPEIPPEIVPEGPVDPSCQPTGAETCDGIDNDCDGKVDEAADGAPLKLSCGSGKGICVGEQICKGANIWTDCTAPSPRTEVCAGDGMDEDCDGQVDEGVNNSVDACGATCAVCPGGANPETSARSCNAVNGGYACGFACRGEFYDADNDLTNGCETRDDFSGHSPEQATVIGSGSISDDSGDKDSKPISFSGLFPADNQTHESAPIIRNAPTDPLLFDWYKFTGKDTAADDMEFFATLDVRDLPPGNQYEVCISTRKNNPTMNTCGAGIKAWYASGTGCACAMGGQSVSTKADLDIDPWKAPWEDQDDGGTFYIRVRWVGGGFEPQRSAKAYRITVADD